MTRLRVAAGVALAMAISTATPTFAQSDYPNRSVTIVSPVATGGTYSSYARILGARLEERLQQPFMVENRLGGGTVVGTNSVAKAAPDGYTLLVAGSPALAISPTVNKSLPYNPVTDFEPIALIGHSPQVLLVNAALPIHSITDMVRYAKENPGKLNYASTGPGTVVHLQAELMKSQLGLDLTHVPYRGAAPALNDIAAGHVSMMFITYAPARALVEAGKIRVIGISTKARDEELKDIPPLAESGLPGFDTSIWYMMVAPANTPQTVVTRLHGEITTAIGDATVRKQLISQGVTPGASPSPAALKDYVRSQMEVWGDVARKAGVAGTM